MKYSDVTAVLLCAGSGERAKLGYNKAFFALENGKTVLQSALEAFADFEHIVLVCSQEDSDKITPLGFPVVLGGKTRSESSKNAIRVVKTPYVLIHDGARPFVSKEVIEASVESAKRCGCGVAAIPATDSLKQVKNGDVRTLTRSECYCVQTPQTFETAKLLAAYERGYEGTDDSEVYEKAGHAVFLSSGDPANKKLTNPQDFAPSSFKIGHGFDVHQLVEGRKLVLGGVELVHDKGLLGHSDADVLTHAVMDALLSGAGKKDIGCLFPDTDDAYKDADSMKLLERVIQEIKPYAVGSVSAVIMAQKPKMAPHIDDMRRSLATCMGIDVDDINISATTTEKLGIVGEEKGIAASAMAILVKNNG